MSQVKCADDYNDDGVDTLSLGTCWIAGARVYIGVGVFTIPPPPMFKVLNMFGLGLMNLEHFPKILFSIPSVLVLNILCSFIETH